MKKILFLLLLFIGFIGHAQLGSTLFLYASHHDDASGGDLSVSYEGSGPVTNASQSTNSIDIAYPSYVSGEYWICQVNVHDGVTYNIPTGWTLIDQGAADGNDATALAMGRFPNGTETGNLTVTSNGTGSNVCLGIIHRYANVNTSTPYEQLTAAEAVSTNTITPPSVTSSNNGGLHVDMIYFDENQGSNDTPGDTNQDYWLATGTGSDLSFGVFSENLNSGESSGGDVSYTFNTTGYGGRYITFILNAQ